ncbi:hypothetical protein H671_5g13453 [Cricetulus griseus]|nr:hypothetical protein H671_5g13453 [Cricetulus griseus]
MNSNPELFCVLWLLAFAGTKISLSTLWQPFFQKSWSTSDKTSLYGLQVRAECYKAKGKGKQKQGQKGKLCKCPLKGQPVIEEWKTDSAMDLANGGPPGKCQIKMEKWRIWSSTGRTHTLHTQYTHNQEELDCRKPRGSSSKCIQVKVSLH